MSFRFSVSAVRSRVRGQSDLFPRTYSHSPSPPPPRPRFGIAFDVDGVTIGGHAPIGGSPQAIQRLYAKDGGGVPESKRASNLSKLLGVNISPLQVLCDILRTGGLPGKEKGEQPALYFAADDLEYQAAFPAERLGMGAFRIALESIFNT
ncbi:Cat eye syndrome critical region protein 5 [Rhynchospora pubera]|uniref:Cat eye syndrome critical region protein 5 n=1 Tax=Rhynchospora pubera TaxID=906938 RepID=A0AAV8CFG2_9POAL|nr:Cat eye syndrome critical region protein 5 [Rhynchospora pubera]